MQLMRWAHRSVFLIALILLGAAPSAVFAQQWAITTPTDGTQFGLGINIDCEGPAPVPANLGRLTLLKDNGAMGQTIVAPYGVIWSDMNSHWSYTFAAPSTKGSYIVRLETKEFDPMVGYAVWVTKDEVSFKVVQ